MLRKEMFVWGNFSEVIKKYDFRYGIYDKQKLNYFDKFKCESPELTLI
jgi:hypothetical protein